MPSLHQHDCAKCNYLGSMEIDGIYHDFYKCTESYVARYGSNGPDYTSYPVSILAQINPRTQVESVFKIEHGIDNSTYKESHYRFALISDGRVINVLASPLLAVNIQNFIIEAVQYHCSHFIRLAVTSDMLWSVLACIKHVVDERLSE